MLVMCAGLAAGSALATESDDLLRNLRPQGLLSDYAGVLKAEERASLESTLRGYQQRTGQEVGVAVVDSLKGGDIDDFANKLFAQWGVGKKGQDNGVLLLVAIKDRSARIEVGYGLEPKLTDAAAGRILREQLFPSFKQGRYGEGLSLAVARIISVAQGETPAPPDPALNPRSQGAAVGGFDWFFWITVSISCAIAFLLGGGIGAKNIGLIIQSGGFIVMFLIFMTGFGVQTGALRQGRQLPFILASLLSLVASIFLGRHFPRFFDRIETAMSRPGNRSGGRGGWSGGGGGWSGGGGGFSGGSSGGGGASGKW